MTTTRITVGSIVRLRTEFDDDGLVCVVIGEIPDPTSPLYRIGVVTPRRFLRGVRISPLRDRLVGPQVLEVLQPAERLLDGRADDFVPYEWSDDGERRTVRARYRGTAVLRESSNGAND